MPITLEYCPDSHSRILIWSLRKIRNFVYNSCLFEFEDIINSVDYADLMVPPQYKLTERALKTIVKRFAKNFKPLIHLNPYVRSISLEREYDIFFTVLDFPYSIASLNLLKNLRPKCTFAVCYIIEIWDQDLAKYKNLLQFFQNFDLICLGHAHVVEKVQKLVNVPCIYLPPGVDTIKFHPDLQACRNRNIDVCSLGRRSDITHQALLTLAEQKQYYYFYDYLDSAELYCNNHREHRTQTANLLKNSRYFITNHAKIDKPQETHGQLEIGYRFFEGAAAGNIMIGKSPNTDVFKHYFDWQDAVIPIAFDEPDIAKIILELDSQPEYLREIQKNNVVNALRKHDWVYRWQKVLIELGIPPTDRMKTRIATLEQMARSCQSLQQFSNNNS